MIKIIFFDFDGTISDAKKLAQESLMEVLNSYGMHFDKQKAKKLLGSKMPEIFKRLGLYLPWVGRARRKFYKDLICGVEEGKISLCVSVSPLEQLKRKGYRLIVITNAESKFTNASIKKLRIGGLFDKIYGAEKFSTKDKLLKELFKKYKIKPKEAVYVGDRYSDIRYAKGAGCWAVAIHNKCSWSSREEILKENPHFIIKNFYELKRILRQLNRNN